MYSINCYETAIEQDVEWNVVRIANVRFFSGLCFVVCWFPIWRCWMWDSRRRRGKCIFWITFWIRTISSLICSMSHSYETCSAEQIVFHFTQVYWLQFGRYFARGPVVSSKTFLFRRYGFHYSEMHIVEKPVTNRFRQPNWVLVVPLCTFISEQNWTCFFFFCRKGMIMH